MGVSKRRRRTKLEIETARMEQARDLLEQIIEGHRRGVATTQGVALIASAYATIALLEREIGRRVTGSLSMAELAHRGETDC